MCEDKKRAMETAKHALQCLETRINGTPSIKVIHRENAERLLGELVFAVWEETNKLWMSNHEKV